MQGTAADIIKLAMINVDNWLQSHQLKSRMIMQVHDELVLEVPEDEYQQVATGIKECMESAANLQVKLVVDVGSGDNWDEAH
jgi:DNA polymerase-1